MHANGTICIITSHCTSHGRLQALSTVIPPLHSFRRSGLRVRPLLRHAFQPQQKQPHGKAHGRQQQAQQAQQAHGRQQQAQHQQGQQHQQGNAARPSQDQSSEQSSQERDRPADSITQSQQGANQTTDSQKPVQAATEAADESQRRDADLQTNQPESQASDRQGKASGKSQKSKRTKKDYAAWAGATAETRAIASAQLQGNPDAADATVLTQTGQPSRPGLSFYLGLSFYIGVSFYLGLPSYLSCLQRPYRVCCAGV